MSEKAYGYTLWRRRPGNLLGDKAEAGGSWFFDLGDREAMTAALDELIASTGKSGASRDEYRLEITDPATGEHVRNVTPIEPSLTQPANGYPVSLEHVSDEALVRELLRRLTRR